MVKECSGEVFKDQFYESYDNATQDKHDFSFMNFAKHSTHPPSSETLMND